MKLGNVIFVVGILMIALCGWSFAASPGFVADTLNDGSLLMCNDLRSSSPDDNVAPLFAVLLLPLALWRLSRRSVPVSWAGTAYFVAVAFLCYLMIVPTRSCADFYLTLFIARNYWLWGFLAGWIMSVAGLALSLLARRQPMHGTPKEGL